MCRVVASGSGKFPSWKNFGERGGLYSGPYAEEILACDLQALTSRAVPLFGLLRPKYLGPELVRDPIPGPWTFLFDDRVAATGSQPGLQVWLTSSRLPFEVRLTVVRSVGGMDPARLIHPGQS